MSNSYTQFSISVPCTPEQVLWMERILNYLRTLQGNETPRTEMTEEEKEMLGGEHLYADFLEMQRMIIEEATSCDYRSYESDGASVFVFYAEESGHPEYVLQALALLTGKYPVSYPEPLHFEWGSFGDRGERSGGFAQVYKGFIDMATITSDFKEEIEATLAGDRLYERITSMGALNPRGASKARAKALELLSKHIDAAHRQFFDLDFREQLCILLSEGEYTEEVLLALLLGSKAN